MKKKLVLLFLMVSSVCYGQNLKISQLPVATTPLSGTELIPIVQSGITKQTTVGAIGISAPCCGLITGNPTLSGNMFIGNVVGNPTLTGTNNVIQGSNSGVDFSTASYNVLDGNGIMPVNTIGSSNSGFGTGVLASNISGSFDVAMGVASLGSNVTGNDLTAIGSQTDVAAGGLSNSIALGYGAVITASNQLVIGSSVTPVTSLVINTVPYNMPATQGASATVLTNDGSGNLTWTAPPSGGITSIGIGNLGDAVGFAPNPLTSNGDINIVWLGTIGQYIDGMGNLENMPSDTPLLAGTNISISRSISGNTISASGGGGSPSLTSTDIGYGSGSNVLTGDANFVRGSYYVSLQDNSTNHNLFLGPSGNSTTTGTYNIAIAPPGLPGHAMVSLTTGSNNIALGGQALNAGVTSGSGNIGIGYDALIDNNGNNNIGIGYLVLTDAGAWNSSNDVGIGAYITGVQYSGSVALGYGAAIPANNTFVVGGSGANAISKWLINTVPYNMPSSQGSSNTYLKNDGSGNLTWSTASGSAALNAGYIGYGNGSNVLTGDGNFVRNSWGICLQDINSVNSNIYIGTVASPCGNNGGDGTSNVGLGGNALVSITNGFYNVALGKNALFSNTSGSNNIALGLNSLSSNSTGSNLIAIGSEIDVSTDGLTNSVAIGAFSGYAPLITESNEFVVSSTIRNWNIGGVAYVIPSSQGASNTYLKNDGSGNLTWASVSGGSAPVYPSNEIPYGDGSTAGGITSPNFTFDGGTLTASVTTMNPSRYLYASGDSYSSTLSFLAGDIDGFGTGAVFGITDAGISTGDVTIPANTLIWNKPGMILNGVTYNLTGTQGSSSTVLTNDGSGNLSWATVSGTPITLTTTGTSGAATLSSGVLNIPQYSGGGGNNITLLGSLTGADLNYSGDQAITLNGGTTYVITNVVYTNVSTDLTASGILQTQINTGASLSGNYIEYENEFVALMSNSSQFMDWNVATAISATERVQHYIWIQPSSSIMGYTATSPIYFSDLVLNGSAATCDIYVYGYVLN
jgi:hypothetical protein